MKIEKYKFRKYDKNYPKLFEKEKKKLLKIFPDAKIEHIGSTAVEGLGGKEIIDINLGVKKSQVKGYIKKLIENKYSFIEKGSDKKERWMFEKDFMRGFRVYRIHVHLTILESHTWKKCILFRDALRKDKKLREEYTKIKKKAFSQNLKDDEYKNYKSKFIENVEKEGLK